MTIDPVVLVGLVWFIAAGFLVTGLRRMTALRTAMRGVRSVAIGMGLAVLAALVFFVGGLNVILAFIAMAVGTVVATNLTRHASASDSFRLIAMVNTFGGAAASLLASAHLITDRSAEGEGAFGGVSAALLANVSVAPAVSVLALLLGAVVCSGSAVAWRRLSSGHAPRSNFASNQTAYLANGAFMLLLALLLGASSSPHPILLSLFAIAALGFGVSMSLPIATSDMPVLIAFFNALAGLAVSLDGLVLDQPTMVVAGAMVFAAGSLLTRLTARNMNRRLSDVMYSGFGIERADRSVSLDPNQMNPIDASEVAISLGYANQVVIVPGYGMAISQAQHKLRELTQLLSERQVKARFVIHPVAGRLPGHMNILLAEAGVPYEQIVDASDISSELSSADVALVVGADDIVNPIARGSDGGDLEGLNIVPVDQAKRVIFLRRGDGIGHSGLDNPLLVAPNTRVMFGDARESLEALIAEVKTLD